MRAVSNYIMPWWFSMRGESWTRNFLVLKALLLRNRKAYLLSEVSQMVKVRTNLFSIRVEGSRVKYVIQNNYMGKDNQPG